MADKVAIIVGSRSDILTLEASYPYFDFFSIPYEIKVISAHRQHNEPLPVIGVPLTASSLNGIDALLSMVQMPRGVLVGTMALDKLGIINAAVYCAEILSSSNTSISEKIRGFRKRGIEIS